MLLKDTFAVAATLDEEKYKLKYLAGVCMKNEWIIQKTRIANISLYLRRNYYNKHFNDQCYFDTPHGIAGNITESIGAWPEFIFRGTFCKRTFCGYCSPCFYSQFPIDKKVNGQYYEEMIRTQYDYIINNFDDLVIKKQ